MRSPTQVVTKYGQSVVVNVLMEALRRDECLCLNCTKLGICGIAKEGFDLCKKYNVAFAMTRCPIFEPKED